MATTSYTIANLVSELANVEHLEGRIKALGGDGLLKATKSGSVESARQQQVIRLSAERQKLLLTIDSRPGVEQLRLICDSECAQWSTNWLKQKRANWCIERICGESVANAMSVVDFAKDFLPTGNSKAQRIVGSHGEQTPAANSHDGLSAFQRLLDQLSESLSDRRKLNWMRGKVIAELNRCAVKDEQGNSPQPPWHWPPRQTNHTNLLVCCGTLAAVHDVHVQGLRIIPVPDKLGDKLDSSLGVDLLMLADWKWHLFLEKINRHPAAEYLVELRAILRAINDYWVNQSPSINEKLNTLKPSEEKAYSQFQEAIKLQPILETATDQEVYKWVEANLIETEDKLPAYVTWERQVRSARKCHGTQKHSSRTGRYSGRSIVSSKDI